MAFDDEIQKGLTRALTDAQASLERVFAEFVSHMGLAAAEERARAAAGAVDEAAAEITRQAEVQVADVKAEAGRQIEAARRQSEKRAEELKVEAERQVEAARRHADERVEHLKVEADRQVDDVRQQAATQVFEARRLAEGQVAEVRRQAETQLGQLREHAQRQFEELRRGAEAQVAEIRLTLDEVRVNTQHQLESMKQAAQSELEQVRRQAETETEAARRGANADAEDLVISQLAAAAADNDERTTEAVERVKAEAAAADLFAALRLADAVRALDAARTLGDLLDYLGQCAGREAPRAAVFVVKGERLQGWRFAGFGGAAPAAKSVELSLDDAGVAGAAVRRGGDPAFDGDAPTPVENLPPIARDLGARTTRALPVLVGGAVVAVLYADAPPDESAQRWGAVLDVLTRHVSRALEAMTVRQAAGLSLPRPLSGSAASQAATPVARGSQPTPEPTPAGSAESGPIQ